MELAVMCVMGVTIGWGVSVGVVYVRVGIMMMGGFVRSVGCRGVRNVRILRIVWCVMWVGIGCCLLREVVFVRLGFI